MPAFEYIALNKTGREERGVIEGDTARQVRQVLRDGNLTPLEVTQVVEKEERKVAGLSVSRGISAADLALFTRQLATLVRSGSPLEEALATTARQTQRNAVKRIILTVRAKVVEGHTLASGMGEFRKVFPELYRATIAAGEQSGYLEAVLERLADYTESRQELQQRVTGALIYPSLLTLIALGVLGGLLGFVVPKIVEVFENSGQQLPFITRALIGVSEIIKGYWWAGVLLLIIAIFSFMWMLRNDEYRFRYHQLLLRLPFVGTLIRGLNTAQFARTFSILAASGVTILEALSISAQVMPNRPMRQAVEKSAVRVREGATIHKSLEASGYFPPMTVYLIASGESSGNLEEMLERAATQQERETNALISNAMSIFEPALIVVMGALVLLIVMAILLPIFDLNQGVI